jgi:hypothetical protein
VILDATDKSIVAKTAVAPTTTAPVFSVDFDDEGSTQKENTLTGTITEALTEILAAPTLNTTSEKAYLKRLNHLTIANTDTVDATVNIYILDNSGIPKQLFQAVLEPNWTLQYPCNEGWGVYDENGVKVFFLNEGISITGEVEIKNDSGSPVPVVAAAIEAVLADILGRLTLGQGTMANSLPVAIASNQSNLPVTDANLKNKIGANAVVTSVAGSATVVDVLASNVNRISCVINNDSTAILYLKYGSGAATTSYTHKLTQDDSVIVDDYNGLITGIWASATGDARVTEVTS